LKARGVQARSVELYDTLPAEALPTDAASALAERGLAAVLVHSPRGAETFARLAGAYDLSEMVALGLSSQCFAPLRRLGFAELVRAQKPSETALLDALLRTLGNPARPR
jgi:uroporphyrinogen-III synthase